MLKDRVEAVEKRINYFIENERIWDKRLSELNRNIGKLNRELDELRPKKKMVKVYGVNIEFIDGTKKWFETRADSAYDLAQEIQKAMEFPLDVILGLERTAIRAKYIKSFTVGDAREVEDNSNEGEKTHE